MFIILFRKYLHDTCIIGIISLNFPNSRNSQFFCLFYRRLSSCCNNINRYIADYLTLMLIKDIPFPIDNYPNANNRLSRVICYHCTSLLDRQKLSFIHCLCTLRIRELFKFMLFYAQY